MIFPQWMMRNWRSFGIIMKFTRPPKKLIQLRLDPRDVRIIDRESKRSGIDRAQLVRSWVKEKISRIHNDERLWGASDQTNYSNKKHFSTTSSTLNFRLKELRQSDKSLREERVEIRLRRFERSAYSEIKTPFIMWYEGWGFSFQEILIRTE